MSYIFKKQNNKLSGAYFNESKTTKGGKNHNPRREQGEILKALAPSYKDLTKEQLESLNQYQDDFWFQLMIQAEVYFELKIFNEAAARYNAYLTKFHQATQAHKRLAQINYINDNYDRAIFHSHRAFENEPDNADLVILVTALLLEYGLENQAADILTTFAKKHPDSKREIIGHAYFNEIPYPFIIKCWTKSREPYIKVVSSTPNTVLDTEKESTPQLIPHKI